MCFCWARFQVLSLQYWKEWVKWCVEFGIEANAIIAVPYDWRLPPSMLEERDLYFHKLKYVTLDSSCYAATSFLR
jgi:hypothetical protein